MSETPTYCDTCGTQQSADGYCHNKQCSRHGRKNDYMRGGNVVADSAAPVVETASAPTKCRLCDGVGFVNGNPYPCPACHASGIAPVAAPPVGPAPTTDHWANAEDMIRRIHHYGYPPDSRLADRVTGDVADIMEEIRLHIASLGAGFPQETPK